MSRLIERVSIPILFALIVFTHPLMAEPVSAPLTLIPSYDDQQAADPVNSDGSALSNKTAADSLANLTNSPLLLSDDVEATTTETTETTEATETTDRWDDYSDRWRLKMTPNLWAAGFNGSVGDRNRKVNIDKSFSDLLDKTQGAAALNFELGKGPLSGIFTGLYYDLDDKGSTENGHFTAKADVKLTILDFGLSYHFLEFPLGSNPGPDPMKLSFDFIPGFRLTYIDTEVNIYGGPFNGSDQSSNKNFFDPYAGGRIRFDLNRHINLTTIGNVGGWGVGTELTYALSGMVEYRFNPKWGVYAGYRVLYDKFDKNSATIDATFQGPVIGLSVRW